MVRLSNSHTAHPTFTSRSRSDGHALLVILNENEIDVRGFHEFLLLARALVLNDESFQNAHNPYRGTDFKRHWFIYLFLRNATCQTYSVLRYLEVLGGSWLKTPTKHIKKTQTDEHDCLLSFVLVALHCKKTFMASYSEEKRIRIESMICHTQTKNWLALCANYCLM